VPRSATSTCGPRCRSSVWPIAWITYPRQLSGGQEQRGRHRPGDRRRPAHPGADEPTGDLDAKSAEEILDLLNRLNKEFHKTIVMVTHDPRAAAHAHRLLHLDKGVLSSETRSRPSARGSPGRP